MNALPGAFTSLQSSAEVCRSRLLHFTRAWPSLISGTRRDHLLPRCREVSGHQRRRRWRLRGLDAPARLPAGAWRDLRVAPAVLSLPQSRQWVRRYRFLSVHEKHGSLGDFVAFMRRAEALGVRVIIDLVVNHTSTDSPWFQRARTSPDDFFREWYVWSDIRPKNDKQGIVFPGQQTTTWTWDRRASQFYFHRFYNHQPDLNTWHPYVRAEIQKIMGFWLQLGVSGFRLDAVPFLIEKKGPGVEHQMDFNLLKEMRDFLQWRSSEAIMLAEANVPPDESLEYFGAEGDRLQMMLNFPVNQRLFYALRSEERRVGKECRF